MRRLVFNQSSPVHPVSESRGGGLSVTADGRRTDKRKSSCLIFDRSSYNYTFTKHITFQHVKKNILLLWLFVWIGCELVGCSQQAHICRALLGVVVVGWRGQSVAQRGILLWNTFFYKFFYKQGMYHSNIVLGLGFNSVGNNLSYPLWRGSFLQILEPALVNGLQRWF